MAGRNDPCPCGSGKKAKKCCFSPSSNGAGRARAPESMQALVTPEMRVALAGVETWQADVVPFPATIGDDPAARPGAVLVAAAGFVLVSELVGRAPSEVADVASLVEAALRSAARALGDWPERIETRHEDVAAELRRALDTRGVRIEVPETLEEIEDLAVRLAADLAGWEFDSPPISAPETWTGWGLPRDVVADLFRSAATFWRARPWVRLRNDSCLLLRAPGGSTWTASVMGYAGQEYGLILYEDERDFLSLQEMEAPDLIAALESWTYSISFEERGDLPRRMQREIVGAGWEIAAPEAYPVLMAFNTPGGGIRRRHAHDLSLALAAVARLVERFPQELSRGEMVEWHDTESGVDVVRVEAADGDRTGRPSLWPAPERLSTAGPEGPSAWPRAPFEVPEPDDLPEGLIVDRGLVLPRLGIDDGRPVVEQLDFDRPVEIVDPDEPDGLDLMRAWRARSVARFAAWLFIDRDLSAATARKHAELANIFLMFLEGQEVSAAAVTDYDLRCFLFDWFPRKTIEAEYRVRAMPVSLGHLFDWLAGTNGIVCPWARETLAERDAYAERVRTFPGGSWWDEEVRDWQADLWDDLDRRVMLSDPSLGEGSTWGMEGPMGPVMGPVEAALDLQLQRRWLVWRDEEIRGGLTEPDPLRAALVRRQRAWETTPGEWLDGMSPVEVIDRERARHESSS